MIPNNRFDLAFQVQSANGISRQPYARLVAADFHLSSPVSGRRSQRNAPDSALPYLRWDSAPCGPVDRLHLLNLAGFPLVGLAAYLLTQGLSTPAAILGRIAVAVFIPIYAAFDALAGVGTGTLVELVNRLAPDEK